MPWIEVSTQNYGLPQPSAPGCLVLTLTAWLGKREPLPQDRGQGLVAQGFEHTPPQKLTSSASLGEERFRKDKKHLI